jgi:chromate transporter
MSSADEEPSGAQASLAAVALQWTRIGTTGFGGPPAHIALLRELVVTRMGWMDARAFEDANAACGLLPGPSSTQLAIFSAYRVAGPPGAIVGGLGFIVPAVVMILAPSVMFLGSAPPVRVRGAGAGAGAAAAALIGTYVVLALLACGLTELLAERHPLGGLGGGAGSLGALVPASITTGGIGALAWTAFKVGALSFGGGFVIVPLMQADAVHTYHWMTNPQFLNAVALGQITPGPVVATVAAVGYAAHGIAGGLLAAVVAFSPSFSFILLGGRRFERIRANTGARAFLDGAGPAAIGAILGSAITLAGALTETWQFAILAAAVVAPLALRRGVVPTLLGAGLVGVIAALAGAPLP